MDIEQVFYQKIIDKFIKKFGDSFKIVPLRISMSFPYVSNDLKRKIMDAVANRIVNKIKKGEYVDSISFGNAVIKELIIEGFKQAGMDDLLDTEFITIKDDKKTEFIFRCKRRKTLPLFVAAFYFNIRNQNIGIDAVEENKSY